MFLLRCLWSSRLQSSAQLPLRVSDWLLMLRVHEHQSPLAFTVPLLFTDFEHTKLTKLTKTVSTVTYNLVHYRHGFWRIFNQWLSLVTLRTIVAIKLSMTTCTVSGRVASNENCVDRGGLYYFVAPTLRRRSCTHCKLNSKWKKISKNSSSYRWRELVRTSLGCHPKAGP